MAVVEPAHHKPSCDRSHFPTIFFWAVSECGGGRGHERATVVLKPWFTVGVVLLKLDVNANFW